MSRFFYPKLAWQNIIRNRRFYVPYLLSIVGSSGAFYILMALNNAPDLPELTRYLYLSSFTGIGCVLIGIFALIFLFYTNSFLTKRRLKELGLYNILGMGKRHIAKMLLWETVYTAAAGIGVGIGFGMLFQKLATMLLTQLILHMAVPYAFYISSMGIVVTLAVFGGILLLNLIYNLFRIRLSNPISLLRGSDVGEREPKSRWVLTLLGIATLGAGYGIAVWTDNPMSALTYYFVAVFLVIIGTYCLFTSVSISVLKLLRRNKKYYYQTRHFIGISGMLYRMKRNAVGLANICILSTMVLVMASGTLSLYLGTEETMRTRYPRELVVELRRGNGVQDEFHPETLYEALTDAASRDGRIIEKSWCASSLWIGAGYIGDGKFITDQTSHKSLSTAQILVMTAEDYTAATGESVQRLDRDEALLYLPKYKGDTVSVDFATPDNPNGETMTWNVSGRIQELPPAGDSAIYTGTVCCIVVSDMDVLEQFHENQCAAYGDEASRLFWQACFDIAGDDEDIMQAAFDALDNATRNTETIKETGLDSVGVLSLYNRYEMTREMYALNGGFLFLGLFLSILFIMAAAMIVYYKQISEGYEDAERFRIMQKVGLEKSDIRASINSQVLVVFFAPLLMAVVHVAFDFKLMTQLLLLFQITAKGLTLGCTAGVLAGFAAIYGIVYLLTAREYYRIVAQPRSI